MNLKKLILVLIAAYAGLLSLDAFSEYDVLQQTECKSEPHALSTLHSTTIVPASDCYTLSIPRTINAPAQRNSNTRRTASPNVIEEHFSQTVKEISKRFFSKRTAEPSFFETVCPKSADYIIRIGILVI